MNNNNILQIINETFEYCIKLYSGMGNVVININDRKLDSLEEYFKNILEGFSWITEIIISLKDYHNEIIELNTMEEKIKMYIEAYSNLDLLLFSNIVEYELMPEVEKFYNILSKLVSDINNEAAIDFNNEL